MRNRDMTLIFREYKNDMYPEDQTWYECDELPELEFIFDHVVHCEVDSDDSFGEIDYPDECCSSSDEEDFRIETVPCHRCHRRTFCSKVTQVTCEHGYVTTERAPDGDSDDDLFCNECFLFLRKHGFHENSKTIESVQHSVDDVLDPLPTDMVEYIREFLSYSPKRCLECVPKK